MCCEYKMSQFNVREFDQILQRRQTLLGDGEGGFPNILLSALSERCNVYKAMSHVALFQGSVVCEGIQPLRMILEYLRYLYFTNNVMRTHSSQKISSKFPFSLCHKLPSHYIAILSLFFFPELSSLCPALYVLLFLCTYFPALEHAWLKTPKDSYPVFSLICGIFLRS